MKKYLGKEFLDSVTLSIEMEGLRSVTFEIYNLTDFFLDAILIDEVLGTIGKKLTKNENMRLSRKLNKILLEIDLTRKLKLTRENKFISKIKNDIQEIISVRNWFSHPRVYFDEIQNLQTNRPYILSKTKLFRKVMASIIDYWLESYEIKTQHEATIIKQLDKLRTLLKNKMIAQDD